MERKGKRHMKVGKIFLPPYILLNIVINFYSLYLPYVVLNVDHAIASFDKFKLNG